MKIVSYKNRNIHKFNNVLKFQCSILNFCKQIFAFIICASFLVFTGCKKFIEVPVPLDRIAVQNVYTTDATAISAVTAMYARLGDASGSPQFQLVSATYCTGLSSDELTLTAGVSGILADYYKNSLTSPTVPQFWTSVYSLVYLANSAIEGLDASSSLTPAVKQQLLGEAKFMRAFGLFYLVNLYGDVPLAVSTDYKINSLMPRTPAAEVWKQIISDLVEAEDLLNTNYVGADVITSIATTERVRPNRWTASALLARAYLYTGDYANAEAEATRIIINSSLYSLSTLSNAFLKNPTINKEAIWQIQTITAGWNTNDARVFILPATGPSLSYPVYLNKRLVYDFEPGDARTTNWIKGIQVGTDSFYHAYKYKSATQNAPITEYNIVFRLAEQYLIRAEARCMQNKLQLAVDDINIIRQQHGGLSTPLPAPTTQSDAIKIILHERRVELFCEWGHRWLDLKRTNTIDAVMDIETPLKGGTWQSMDKLYPIGNDDLRNNPNLSQTPGY